MRSCGEKTDNSAREDSGQVGALWRAVNNTDIFISCELISQFGHHGSNTVKVRQQLWTRLCVS